MAGLKVAVTALLYQAVLGNPLSLARSAPEQQRRAPIRGSGVEAFSNSGMDYHTWTQRMVDEGKMWYPAERSVEIRSPSQKMETVVVRHPGGSLSLRQQPPQAPDFIIDAIACYGLGGGNENYQEGKEKFCGWGDTIFEFTTTQAHYMLEDGFCEGNFLCDLQMSIVLYGGRWLVEANFDEICTFWWDAIYDRCQGKGGSGKIIFNKNRDELGESCGKPTCKPGGSGVGTEIGSLWAEYTDHDDGATCPAPTQSQVCKIDHFN